MDAEWMLQPHFFQSLSQLNFIPNVDLFVTHKYSIICLCFPGNQMPVPFMLMLHYDLVK